MTRRSPALVPQLSHNRRSRLSRAGRTLTLCASVLLLSAPTSALSRQAQPRQAQTPLLQSSQAQTQTVSDAEFWSIFSRMSEPGGSFVSENFVSNEMSFQYVIPTLQRQLTPGGVYLGVGPEQNYTYIANLRPQLAVIFDIRRQNAMQHLLYKALFEQSATRAEFVARLFSRPSIASQGTEVSAKELFAAAELAPVNDSAFEANQKAVMQLLTAKHGFALSPEDLGTITYLYRVFQTAGPSIDYSYRLGRGAVRQSRYPDFGMLQMATNADSVPMAFLGTEENYRRVRAMHQQNLIIPVVGDFAGPSAIRSVGDMLRKRNLKVTAFYLSNVEQYLFRTREAPRRFYDNVAALPLDSTATFIRSVPGNPGVFNFAPLYQSNRSSSGSVATGSSFSVSIVDSGGVRVVRTTQDSAGIPISRMMIDSTQMTPGITDSARARMRTQLDSFTNGLASIVFTGRDSSGSLSLGPSFPLRPAGLPSFGSQLTSGLMPMRDMLSAYNGGHVQTYQDVIGMTRTSGWK